MVSLLGIQAGRGAATPGAERGPHELRKRGLIQRLAANGREVQDLGDIPGVYETRFGVTVENLNNLRYVLQVNRHTHACVLGTRRKHPRDFLLIVGGDHSLAIGTLAGLSDACQRLGIIWIDAHGDFNTPASSPSGNIHGMSLAVACGHGHRDLRSIADRDPLVLEDDVHLFGVRDVDEKEQENLDHSAVDVLPMPKWRRRGVVESTLAAVEQLASRCDHIHLSFDIDVLDPKFVPGTGTPVPGGLSDDEARTLMAALAAQGLIGSAEIVEYNPRIDPDFRTGELTLDLISRLLATTAAT